MWHNLPTAIRHFGDEKPHFCQEKAFAKSGKKSTKFENIYLISSKRRGPIFTRYEKTDSAEVWKLSLSKVKIYIQVKD